MTNASPVAVFPSSAPTSEAVPPKIDASQSLTLESGTDQVGGPAQRSSGEVDLSSLTARVAALEAILAGFTEQSISFCDGGSPTTKTFLTK